MSPGPKRAVDESSLPWRPRSTGSTRFAKFCERFIIVPKGKGARTPLILRDWQRDLVGSVLDAETQPRTAVWTLGRGNGKSTLLAAWALYELFEGGEGATVIVCAVDERQAGIIFNSAVRMTELNDDLGSRVQVFKDRMTIPSRGATFYWLPAEPKRLEGLDYSLALVDECGVVNPETWQVVCLASGKREVSTVVGIGTPSVNPDSVLANARRYARDFPDDKTTAYREHSAAGFEDHPTTCVHCWRLANPALGDFLAEDSMLAVQPPKMSEAAFRRARLCQFVDANESPFIEAGIWDALSTGVGVRDGAEVVIALDGSLSDDSTALLVGTVSATPHFDKLAVWANPGDPEWRINVQEVEAEIRKACKRWNVREIIADPAYWTRSLQILASEGLPIMEFPHSPTRQTAATNDLHTCALNGRMTHSGDETLRLHVLNATVVESDRGIRISKASRKRSAGKVDLCACLVMAHSRATWLAMKKKKRAYAF
jgi:phage terminase large subunit-like protein